MKLAHFYIKLVLNHGEFSMISTTSVNHNGNVELDYDFSNNSTPSNTNITIHGLTKQHAGLFTKGKVIDVYAGYYNEDWTQNNIAHVVNNIIYHTNPLHNDGGDPQLQISLQDGTKKYSKDKTLKVAQSKRVRNKASMSNGNDTGKELRSTNGQIRAAYDQWRSQNKSLSPKSKQVHMMRQQMNNQIKASQTQIYQKQARQQNSSNDKEKYRYKTVYRTISFKAGTYGSQIIRKIADMAGIPIYKMSLVYDRKYLNGYRAGKKPFQVIKDVAKDCKTSIYFPHGQLTIADFAQEPQMSIILNMNTGLLSQPEFQQDDSGITYNITAIFQPRLTVGSTFRIESDELTDDVIVQSGHSNGSRDGTPQTTLNVRQVSRYKNRQNKAINSAQKQSEKRDAYNRQQAQQKRQKRQQNRKGK